MLIKSVLLVICFLFLGNLNLSAVSLAYIILDKDADARGIVIFCGREWTYSDFKLALEDTAKNDKQVTFFIFVKNETDINQKLMLNILKMLKDAGLESARIVIRSKSEEKDKSFCMEIPIDLQKIKIEKMSDEISPPPPPPVIIEDVN